MTSEAAQFIHRFYLNLRQPKRENSELFQVTIRQLESLIRLSSARARAELREEITVEVAIAFFLLSNSVYLRVNVYVIF